MIRFSFRNRYGRKTCNPPARIRLSGLHRLRAALWAVAALVAAGPAVAADYVNDPAWAWGSGRMLEDAFYGSYDQDYVGRALARFDDGDVVVAGTVPHAGGYGAIGLVRYAADGVSGRTAWTNPGAYGTNDNQYVVLPGQLLQSIIGVQKVIVHGSLMFVLADVETYRLSGNPPGSVVFNGDGAAVYVFGTDGSFKNSYLVDRDEDDQSGGAQTVFGGGLAAYTSWTGTTAVNSLLYVGRKKAGSIERITYRRYTFTTAGVLTAQTDAIHPAISECGSTIHCSGFGIALGGSATFTGAPRVYLTGSRYQQCDGICYDGWWAFAAQINPVSGASTGMNFRYMTRGRGRAIAVDAHWGIGGTRDDVYVLAERDQNCKMGMVVSASRQEAPTVWEKVIGGSTNTGIDCDIDEGLRRIRTVFPKALALQDGRLAAVGYGSIPPETCASAPCEDVVDGAIAVLDAGNGDMISPGAPGSGGVQPNYHEYTNTSGARTRHSGFYDVVAAGDGAFTVAGDTRIRETSSTPSYRGRMQYASLRVIESGAGDDVIFRHGFEAAAGMQRGDGNFDGVPLDPED